jgi:P4 family phage/plasmid primase-like protien
VEWVTEQEDIEHDANLEMPDGPGVETVDLEVKKDTWKCISCGETMEIESTFTPITCENPNCTTRGPYVPQTGPYTFFDGHTNKEGFYQRGEFVPERLAKAILEKHTFATMKENREIFVYSEGVYLPEGEVLIDKEAQKLLGHLSKSNRVLETIGYIRRGSYKKSTEFGGPVELLAVNNGVLNLDTEEFSEHSPENMFLTKLPVDYDKDATCPEIEKFFSDVLKEDNIPVVQEGFGYCLWKDYPYAKAFMFKASGENGKSQVLNLLSALIGEDNICNHSIHKLIFDRFSTVDLFGKLCNVHADIPEGELGKTGVFKMLTGRDTIQGEKKCIQGKIPFKNHAKMFFSTNQLPKTSDTSHAFFRRWVLLTFPYTFVKEPAGPLEKKDNPNILKEIITPQSLSGLLNWALIGLKRLRKNDTFTYSKSAEEDQEEWEASADSLRYFVQKRIVYTKKAHINKDDFFKTYCEFCAENELDITAKASITKTLPTILPGVYLGRPREGPKKESRPSAWLNIAFVDDGSLEQKEHILNNSLADFEKNSSFLLRSSSNYVPSVPIEEDLGEVEDDPPGWLGPEIDDEEYDYNGIQIKRWRREEIERRKRRQKDNGGGKSEKEPQAKID